MAQLVYIPIFLNDKTTAIGIYNKMNEARSSYFDYFYDVKLKSNKWKNVIKNIERKYDIELHDKSALYQAFFDDEYEFDDILYDIQDELTENVGFMLEEVRIGDLFDFRIASNWDQDNLYISLENLLQGIIGDIAI